jgi:CheY-like chemotaxis protein
MVQMSANMLRVLLVNWNAEETSLRADALRAHGFLPRTLEPHGLPALRALREDPPDVILIDLGRMPSQGRAVATTLRQQKATRAVPLVFVGGDPEKVARIRQAFPDAGYAQWRGIAAALRKAAAAPPANPIVPGTMSAYSGTPLPKKLGIKPGSTVLLLGAPERIEEILGPPPGGAAFSRSARQADLILLFSRSRADFERRLPAAAAKMKDRAGLWVVWPKKTSGVASDLNGNMVREIGLAAGLVDYKICAVDETWSGLLFAHRRSKTT